jgi:hypothetical protein
LRELWINNELVELYDDEPIALTKQVNKLNELKDRQADYSNQFSIPPTGNNLRICGYPDRVSSDSINPYTKLACTYIENGSELISNGIAIIEDYTGGDIQITAYSGIFDFFDQLGENTLRDLDLSGADHVFNIESVIAGNYSDKYIYPLIQWGGTDTNDNVIDIRYQMPALRVPYLIDKIFESTNYNKAGEVFDIASYHNLVIPIVEESLIDTEEVLLANSFKTHIQNNIIAPTGYVQPLDMYYFGSGDAFNSTALLYTYTHLFAGLPRGVRYTAKTTVFVDIRFGLYVRGVPHLDPLIWVSKNGVVGSAVSTPGGGKYIQGALGSAGMNTGGGSIQYVTLEISNVRLDPGDYISLYYHNDIKEFYVDGSILGNPGDYSFFSATAVNIFELGQNLSLTTIAPAIKQRDLLKEIAHLYGIIFQVDHLTRTVTFKRFQEISDSKLTDSVDWSDKLYVSANPRDPKNPQLKYRFESYGQYNHMKWIQDDTRGEIGDGYIFVDDNTLKKDNELFTSIFASSIQSTNLKGNVGVDIKRFTRVEADSYNNLTDYDEGDLTLYNGIVYEAQQDTTGILPGSNPAYWVPLERQYEKTENVQPRLLLIREFTNSFSPPSIVYTDGDDSEELTHGSEYSIKVITRNVLQTYGGANFSIGDLVNVIGVQGEGIYEVFFTSPVVSEPGSAYLIFQQNAFSEGERGTIVNAKNPKIAYFADSTQEYDLTYQSLISNHYQGLVSVLNKAKIPSCYFKLTENEFKNIDFFKPVYVNYFGDYFYINIVPNFISGRLASVELVRL